MGVIAIIPARGGSKRIPGKNIRPFLGKPIIAYSIDVAIQSGLFTEVVVSTDSEEIAAVARQYGAAVPFLRSAANSDDFATASDVLLEVLDAYRLQGKVFEYGCCIFPTAPLISVEQLAKGFETLKTKGGSTVFPVVAFSYPIWRGLAKDSTNGKVTMVWPENISKRSQDLQKVYHDAGQWYWFKSSDFSLKKTLFNDHSFGVEVDEMDIQDIDNLSDWEIAELKYRMRLEKK